MADNVSAPAPGLTSGGAFNPNAFSAWAIAQAQSQSQGGGTTQKEPMIPRYTRVSAGNRPRWNPLTRRYESAPQGAYSTTSRTVTQTQYIQEFYDKWDDPNFQTWMMSRAIASGRAKSESTYDDYLSTWIWAGDMVAKGIWKGTPEEFLEWAASGQQMSAEGIAKAIASGEPIMDADGNPVLPGLGGPGGAAAVNPITTHRSTQSATINREAAYAAADQMSMALLGRMATKAEMRKARGVMNGLLKSNPTVSTTTTDATDPNNVVSTTNTSDGMSAADAQNALEMKIRRSSEGTAYTVGSMFEDSMRILAEQEG